MRATACARVRYSVRDGVRAKRHSVDASKASRQSHLKVSPVYESSEGGEESAYDDSMSLEHLCATCRAARKLCLAWLAVHAPHSAVGADRGAPQSLHLFLRRLCSQMEAPPQSLHWFLTRLRSQMEASLAT
jgi:hypothetical protein